MPKKTYFNLDEDKQKRILNAAKEEFSRVPLAEASINNIIKTADIPRGSFYQYFENKEDLYFYYFDSIRQNQTKKFMDTLEANHGDIVKTMKEFFSEIIADTVSGENAAFFKNVFVRMDFKMAHHMQPHGARPHAGRFQHPEFHLGDKVDLSLLNISTDEELKLLMFSMMSPFMRTINDYFSKQKQGIEIPVEELQKEYETMANWVAIGVSKREEQE
ncbi:TetR/AcrR family transcriptional regulator [Dellaglioa sp. BT-FLS60]